MGSILGTTWRIRLFTEHTPFQPDAIVEITEDARVKFDGKEGQGSHDASKNKVTVRRWMEMDVHWEFVASETRETGSEEFIMYGCSWGRKEPRTDPGELPDPMGSWVAEPQGF